MIKLYNSAIILLLPMDYLSLKAELLVNGIDATPDALNEVGVQI